MKRLTIIFALVLLPLSALAVTSRAWTQIGCSTGNMNWSNNARWKCTSGTGCTNACGSSDPSGTGTGYPSIDGDSPTVGGWVTTVDVNVTAGDSTQNSVSSIILPNSATIVVPLGVTLTTTGQGITLGSVNNAKLHIEGTVHCLSNGTNVTFCPAQLYAAGSGTNIVEICGQGASCTGPPEDSQGYMTAPCTNNAHILGDAAHPTLTGPHTLAASSAMLWKIYCADFTNLGYNASGTTFNVVDANAVQWISSHSWGMSNIYCHDVIQRVRHLDIRSSSVLDSQFNIYITGCNTPTTVTQPQLMQFITSDVSNKFWQFYVSTQIPFTVDHYAGGYQISTINGSASAHITNYAYVLYTTTVFSASWGWLGPVTAYGNNVFENMIVAPYSTASQSTWIGSGMDEDSTTPPPGTGPNIVRNSFWDGWGNVNGTNRQGNTNLCTAYYFGNIAFNGAGRLVTGAGSMFDTTSYPHCAANGGGRANVGLVANFNNCDSTMTSSTVGVPGCMAVMALYGSLNGPNNYPSNDRANDFSANIFTRDLADISQTGQGSYQTTMVRQNYLNYDYNVYSGMTRTGNYKTASGGNTYLAAPQSSVLAAPIVITAATFSTPNVTFTINSTAGCAANGCAGYFIISGMTNPGNNSTPNAFNCTTTTTTTVKCYDITGVTESSSSGIGVLSATTRTQLSNPTTPRVGPFHLSSAPTGIQVGDVLCKATFTSTPTACGIISAISGSDVTVGGPTLYLTDGSVGTGQDIVIGDTLAMYSKYTSDTNPDYGATNRGGNDLPVDPAYFDNTCSLARWDTINGGYGSYANHAQSVNANMVQMNGFDLSMNPVTFNTAYKIENALAYLRRCWTPHNGMLKNAVKDATRCGQLLTVTGRGNGVTCDPGAIDAFPAAIISTN